MFVNEFESYMEVIIQTFHSIRSFQLIISKQTTVETKTPDETSVCSSGICFVKYLLIMIYPINSMTFAMAFSIPSAFLPPAVAKNG
jgi:hypothetical protein